MFTDVGVSFRIEMFTDVGTSCGIARCSHVGISFRIAMFTDISFSFSIEMFDDVIFDDIHYFLIVVLFPFVLGIFLDCINLIAIYLPETFFKNILSKFLI